MKRKQLLEKIKIKALPNKLHNIHFFYEEPLVYDFPYTSTVDKAYFYNFLKHFFFNYKLDGYLIPHFFVQINDLYNDYDIDVNPPFQTDLKHVPYGLYSNPFDYSKKYRTSDSSDASLDIETPFYTLEYKELAHYFVFDTFLPAIHPHATTKTIVYTRLVAQVDQLYAPFKELISEQDFCFVLDQITLLLALHFGCEKLSYVTKNVPLKDVEKLKDWQPSFPQIWNKEIDVSVTDQSLLSSISEAWQSKVLPFLDELLEKKYFVLRK